MAEIPLTCNQAKVPTPTKVVWEQQVHVLGSVIHIDNYKTSIITKKEIISEFESYSFRRI